MTYVDALFKKIDIPGRYKAKIKSVGVEFPYTDEELREQLMDCLNRAVDTLVEQTQTGSVFLNLQVNSPEGYLIAMSACKYPVKALPILMDKQVTEFFLCEVPYLWWLGVDPSCADGGSRLSLIHRVKESLESWAKKYGIRD